MIDFFLDFFCVHFYTCCRRTTIPGGIPPKVWVWECMGLLETLTLFSTQTQDFRYFTSDLNHKRKPYFRPDLPHQLRRSAYTAEKVFKFKMLIKWYFSSGDITMTKIIFFQELYINRTQIIPFARPKLLNLYPVPGQKDSKKHVAQYLYILTPGSNDSS